MCLAPRVTCHVSPHITTHHHMSFVTCHVSQGACAIPSSDSDILHYAAVWRLVATIQLKASCAALIGNSVGAPVCRSKSCASCGPAPPRPMSATSTTSSCCASPPRRQTPQPTPMLSAHPATLCKPPCPPAPPRGPSPPGRPHTPWHLPGTFTAPFAKPPARSTTPCRPACPSRGCLTQCCRSSGTCGRGIYRRPQGAGTPCEGATRRSLWVAIGVADQDLLAGHGTRCACSRPTRAP